MKTVLFAVFAAFGLSTSASAAPVAIGELRQLYQHNTGVDLHWVAASTEIKISHWGTRQDLRAKKSRHLIKENLPHPKETQAFPALASWVAGASSGVYSASAQGGGFVAMSGGAGRGGLPAFLQSRLPDPASANNSATPPTLPQATSSQEITGSTPLSQPQSPTKLLLVSGGEESAQLVVVPLPAGGTMMLSVLALGGLFLAVRRRRGRSVTR